jgi:GAF domain-containing protein
MSDAEFVAAALHRDELALAAGLNALSTLVAGAATLEQLLTEIAGYTMRAVPGADGAGVTMLATGDSDTIVASKTFVRDVDTIQYRLGEGPCVSAAATASISMSGALGADESWPEFGPRAAALGVHSALSLPLIVAGEVIGSLNVYAHVHDAFDAPAARIGALFAAAAAVAVHNARTLDRAQQEKVWLEAELTSRATIDRAVGIIMSRSGIDEEQAFVRLRIMSQQQHLKMKIVAAKLVEEAVRRARARTPRSDTDQ